MRHRLGLKVPAGLGWVTDPKRAAYNRVYQRTTAGIEDLAPHGTRRSSRASRVAAVLMAVLILYLFAKVFL